MVDFATAASQNVACITQEMCIMIKFHNYLMIKDESNKKDTELAECSDITGQAALNAKISDIHYNVSKRDRIGKEFWY